MPKSFVSSSVWYWKKLPSKKIPTKKKKPPEEIHKTDAKATKKQKNEKVRQNNSTSAELTDMDMGKMPADKVKTFLGKSISDLN